MNIKLSQNIRSLRKERSMTQEQLAEAMQVTSGAVYKWEAGLSVPDISIIVELVNYFDVSIDSLIGYTLKTVSVENIVEKIKILGNSRKYDEARKEAEDALKKYPNDFSVLFGCGKLYQRISIECDDEESAVYAISLHKRALAVISQNKDPDICEGDIIADIAECYLAIGEADEAITILKENNYAGIHNGSIGMTYSTILHQPKEAQPFLARAFADYMQGILHIMIGYAYSYLDLDDSKRAKDTLLWLIFFIDSLREERDKIIYVDKIKAVLFAILATLSSADNDSGEMLNYLKESFSLALRFDGNPIYSTEGILFCESFDETIALYDSLGKSAIEAVEKILYDKDEVMSDIIISLWEKVKDGNHNEEK